jgi:hypothetical protein
MQKHELRETMRRVLDALKRASGASYDGINEDIETLSLVLSDTLKDVPKDKVDDTTTKTKPDIK